MMRRRKTSNFNSAKLVKAVILGQDGVGKSALTVRFLTRRYIWEYDQTMEATYRYHTEVDNDSIALDLSDTAGENTEEKLRAVARMGDLFLVLYSITDRASFNEAKRIGRYLKDCKNTESLCMALVGTKSDLEHLRTVDVEEGTDLSGELESTFYEISIREGVKEVQDMMHDAIKHYLQHRLRFKDSLRVPTIGLRRSPSFDRKKLRASTFEKTNGGLSHGYHAAERLKSKSSAEVCVSPFGNRSTGYNRIKELSSSLMSFGSSSDLRVADQNHNWKVPSDEELNKGSKGYNFSKAKGPFFIQKAKGTSIAKGLKVPPVVTTADVRTVEGSSDTKTKNPFMLNRMRKGSSEVTKEPVSHEKIEKVKVKVKPSSPSFRKKTSPTVESPKSGRAQEKPKGPFSLGSASTDKLRSSSNEKLRNASSDKGRSTSSLSRMKEGITRSFRRKPIYL